MDHMTCDLHMHTRASDGTDTPNELLQKVRACGLACFSVTDHDAVKSCEAIRPLLEPGDPVFITGVEFSCRDGEGKYHILGYGCDPASEPVRAIVEKGHAIRMRKVLARLEALKREFGFGFPKHEIDALLALDNPGKPHIGNLMVKYGYAQSKNEAIKQYIDRTHYKNEHITPREAIEGVLAGGGIPVLAHPFYGDGGQLILGEAMEERLQRLMGFGLRGVEAYYSGFTPKLVSKMLELADGYDLYVTEGSDYHGANKMIELGDTGRDAETPPPERLMRFLDDVPKVNG